jgi:hypothetical protein
MIEKATRTERTTAAKPKDFSNAGMLRNFPDTPFGQKMRAEFESARAAGRTRGASSPAGLVEVYERAAKAKGRIVR